MTVITQQDLLQFSDSLSRPVSKWSRVLPCPSCLFPTDVGSTIRTVECGNCGGELSRGYISVCQSWASRAGSHAIQRARPLPPGDFYWTPPEWVVYAAGLALAGIIGNRADAIFVGLVRLFLKNLPRNTLPVNPSDTLLKEFYAHLGEFYWLRESGRKEDYADQILRDLRSLEATLSQAGVRIPDSENSSVELLELLSRAIEDLQRLRQTYTSIATGAPSTPAVKKDQVE